MVGLLKPIVSLPYSVRSRFVPAAGVRCRIFEAGIGPPLLLLPSPLIDASAYRPLIRDLAGGFQVTAVELPGSGHSDRVADPWTVDEYVTWLARAAAALGLRKFLLVGHSNSGAIAFRFAERFPEQVQGVVLADTIGFDPSSSLLRAIVARVATAIRELRFSFPAVRALARNLFVHRESFFYQLRIAARLKLRPVSALTPRTLVAWGAPVERSDEFAAEVLRFAMR